MRAAGELQEQERRWQTQWQQLSEELQRESLSAAERAALEDRRQALLASRVDWRRFSTGWLLASGGFYLLSTMVGWRYWVAALRSMGQTPQAVASFRAYSVGNLGKYIPGKAMVVVLRIALIRGPTVAGWAAGAAVFIETLTYMAVGAVIGAALLPWVRPVGGVAGWMAAAIAIALVAALSTAPPVFRHVVRRIIRRYIPTSREEFLQGINGSLIVRGWFMMPWAWLLVGLSFWASSRALPGDVRAWQQSLQDLPVLLAVASMAVVLGFVSFVPGGVGVRELVIGVVLGQHPAYGAYRALALGVVVRLVWLLTEILIALIMYVWPAGLGQSAPETPPNESDLPPAEVP
jgi:hypothetical protein